MISCPADVIYDPSLCNVVVAPALTIFNTETVFISDTIPTILEGCGPVSMMSRDSVVTENCVRTIHRFYIAIGFHRIWR
ncbi:MAG: hypothetical protein IPJ43_20550 [Saprospiraceae bacterium]|nr:hypothetical protein [Saprospiraceae bacterium]